MNAKLITDPNKKDGLLLIIPNTGNAASLLLEWASFYSKSPISKIYSNLKHSNLLAIELGSSHSFYSEALIYINSNL